MARSPPQQRGLSGWASDPDRPACVCRLCPCAQEGSQVRKAARTKVWRGEGGGPEPGGAAESRWGEVRPERRGGSGFHGH